ncbi:hypothetical protein SAY87_015244 [Trapa incisa]|uniref:Uncharacterized protein n=1 Tax=Trapa incisa TaxID=236973 RepID=A0AAN7JM58_9MYRT|nr:hypothetical protein SAY87_015244 [Trapa incisa]
MFRHRKSTPLGGISRWSVDKKKKKRRLLSEKKLLGELKKRRLLSEKKLLGELKKRRFLSEKKLLGELADLYVPCLRAPSLTSGIWVSWDFPCLVEVWGVYILFPSSSGFLV